jgi:hypothetical protein
MSLKAGVAVRDITPKKPLFLAGYPHVPRISEGVHDPLSASAVCLKNNGASLLFIAVDTLFISAETANFCRAAIRQNVGLAEKNILISATHTHSGPLTTRVLAWKDDPVVPPPDPDYLKRFHQQIIDAGVVAVRAAEPANIAIVSATATGVGCNRLDPKGPIDPEIGLLAIQRKSDRQLIALILIYGMHPTVLHEDSRLVSCDFPHFARQYLSNIYPEMVSLYHLGPCGNLSPRYQVQANTFPEAEKFGNRLAAVVAKALHQLTDEEYSDEPRLSAHQGRVELPVNSFVSVPEAENNLRQARETYEQLKHQGALHGPVRTAECVVFGREEALSLARAQASGELAQVQQRYRHAEVQVFGIDQLSIVAWPGEQFVEYGLDLKRRAGRRAFVISLANGELQGYIVTPEAAEAGSYESSFSLFQPQAGECLIAKSLCLMEESKRKHGS